MAASVTLITANGSFSEKKKHSVVRRLKSQVLVSEVNFVKRKRSLLFEICRYLFASHEVNMPYLT